MGGQIITILGGQAPTGGQTHTLGRPITTRGTRRATREIRGITPIQGMATPTTIRLIITTRDQPIRRRARTGIPTLRFAPIRTTPVLRRAATAAPDLDHR